MGATNFTKKSVTWRRLRRSVEENKNADMPEDRVEPLFVECNTLVPLLPGTDAKNTREIGCRFRVHAPGLST